MKRKLPTVFDLIAPVYALAYGRQVDMFSQALRRVQPELSLADFDTVLDVGCGTGALLRVLSGLGLSGTGVDPSEKMLDIARRKGPADVQFIAADALLGLPFEDGSFDIAIASYVAHGMQPPQRARLYGEMARVARRFVVIHDFNSVRNFTTSVIERLEGGDYFNFIRSARQEIQAQFGIVREIGAGPRASWYVFPVSG